MGPRLAPVFWAGTIDDEELLYAVGTGLFAGTDGKALLWHTLHHGASAFLVIPLMFHLVDEVGFVAAVRSYLREYDPSKVPWFEERCELVIVHNGLSQRAVPAEGSTTSTSSRHACRTSSRSAPGPADMARHAVRARLVEGTESRRLALA